MNRGHGSVLGPVFAYERIAASRRWQGYALRSFFVACLLAALISTWWNRPGIRNTATLQALAALGQDFYLAAIGTQLTLVMLAAPAATAGAICLDRARGTLTHLLMTDLTDREIVLGKLAARLLPVLGLVGCALPVTALLALLGGVDSLAIVGAFLVTVGMAVLGCCLALLISLWAGKTHEALLGTYAVWGIWMLAAPMVAQLNRTFGLGISSPFNAAPPFDLAFAPYWRPGRVDMGDYFAFLGLTLGVSAALTVVAVVRLRPVCTRENVRKRRPLAERWARLGPLLGRLTAWTEQLPSPSLDGNPVLWREWHRNRPSLAARIVGAVFVALTTLFSLIACFSSGPSATAAWVNGLQVSVGMLLLSVTAATSLAEERVRGSLDVLMSTPLETHEIVLGKWLSCFRRVPALAVLPAIVVLASAQRGHGLPSMLVTVLFVLCCGAAVTSVGLAFATWVSRLGRAVALTITLYVFFTVGCMFLALLTGHSPAAEGAMMISPFFGPGELAFDASGTRGEWSGHLAWGFFWSLCYAAASGALLAATLITFNRCLGRVENGVRFRRQTRADEPARGAELVGESVPVA
ncbi:MAG: ABC transporter permease [Isosphaeraceae bacterium]|nr:ABC transporter permease [Isosphaeraceae bacterium]